MNILFGEVPLSKTNQNINFLILYAIQYIFQCLYNKKIPIFQGLLYHLSLRYEIEKCVSVRNSSMNKFNVLWKGWEKLFVK